MTPNKAIPVVVRLRQFRGSTGESIREALATLGLSLSAEQLEN